MADTSPPSNRLPAESSVAPMPTGATVFLRTFIPWQLVRFAVINLKMVRLIWRSHATTSAGR